MNAHLPRICLYRRPLVHIPPQSFVSFTGPSAPIIFHICHFPNVHLFTYSPIHLLTLEFLPCSPILVSSSRQPEQTTLTSQRSPGTFQSIVSSGSPCSSLSERPPWGGPLNPPNRPGVRRYSTIRLGCKKHIHEYTTLHCFTLRAMSFCPT